MKKIILTLSLVAFVAACSSNEKGPDAGSEAPVAPEVTVDDTSASESTDATEATDATESTDATADSGEAEEAESTDAPGADAYSAEAGLALIDGADCRACHHDSNKLVGPSYKEVAAKYSEKDLDYLAQKIIDGGKGVWGEIPMTPHTGLSMDDAKAMATYVLSVK